MERKKHRPEQELSKQESERQAEAQKIVEKINDPRLKADEHLEYFTIHLKQGVRHVPKRRPGETSAVSQYIENQLRQILEEEM